MSKNKRVYVLQDEEGCMYGVFSALDDAKKFMEDEVYDAGLGPTHYSVNSTLVDDPSVGRVYKYRLQTSINSEIMG